MSIGIIISYGRSEGTLLNLCIGSLADLVIMSEVSPLRIQGASEHPITVKEQSEKWYGIKLKGEDFVETILELHRTCIEQSKHLVVRLWCVGEFRPARQNYGVFPERFLDFDPLRQHCDDLKSVALIGDPIDIWISNGCKRDFFKWYRSYIIALFQLNISIFKYEDFYRRPDTALEVICRELDLPFSNAYRNFASFDSVLGDLLVPYSRGAPLDIIKIFRRRQIATSHIKWVNNCEDMKIANKIANYPQTYYGTQRETLMKRVSAELREFARRLQNV